MHNPRPVASRAYSLGPRKLNFRKSSVSSYICTTLGASCLSSMSDPKKLIQGNTWPWLTLSHGTKMWASMV